MYVSRWQSNYCVCRMHDSMCWWSGWWWSECKIAMDVSRCGGHVKPWGAGRVGEPHQQPQVSPACPCPLPPGQGEHSYVNRLNICHSTSRNRPTVLNMGILTDLLTHAVWAYFVCLHFQHMKIQKLKKNKIKYFETRLAVCSFSILRFVHFPVQNMPRSGLLVAHV